MLDLSRLTRTSSFSVIRLSLLRETLNIRDDVRNIASHQTKKQTNKSRSLFFDEINVHSSLYLLIIFVQNDVPSSLSLSRIAYQNTQEYADERWESIICSSIARTSPIWTIFSRMSAGSSRAKWKASMRQIWSNERLGEQRGRDRKKTMMTQRMSCLAKLELLGSFFSSMINEDHKRE